MLGTILWNVKKLRSLISCFSQKNIQTYLNKMELYKKKSQSNTANVQELIIDTTKNTPLISVVTPAYNAERFLPSLAESLKRQTVSRDMQWVVVDDCSTDNTQSLLLSLAKQYKDFSVKVIKNKINKGASFSLNRGFQVSDGKYIAWISADDEYLDTKKLEKDLQILEKGSDVVFSKYTLIKYSKGSSKLVESIIPEDNTELFLYLTFSSNLNGSSLVLKKEHYLMVGGFDENLWNVDSDYDLFAKLSLLNLKFALSDSTVLRRIHKHQTSQQMPIMRLGTSLTRSRFSKIETLRELMIKKLQNIRNFTDSFNLAANFSFFFLDISENAKLPILLRFLKSLLRPYSETTANVMQIYKNFVEYMTNLDNFSAFKKLIENKKM
ncbi:MAG: glycosyltransferase family 2 protein [Fervidobacterium sp.]|nr:glycosyltransferase family 2 protein [Fervidobacterium sp.]